MQVIVCLVVRGSEGEARELCVQVDSVYQIPPQATFVQNVSPLEIVAAHIRLFETAQTFYSVNIPPHVSLFLCTLG